MSVVLYAGEAWAVVQKNHPLAVYQMNWLRRNCDISLLEYVPAVNILNRCNTFSVESQLQSKRLRWLAHTLRMPHNNLP